MQQRLLDNSLERTFYKSWKGERCGGIDFWPALELIINGKCDQKCSYCYITNYGKDLFPAGSQEDQKILDNTVMIMEWLKRNNLKPRIDLFSAEIFSQEIGFQVLDLIYQLGWEGMYVGIPSNFNFLFDEEKTNRVLSTHKKFFSNNKKLYLSCSVDGKYMEDNRPIRDGKLRDDSFYKKLFSTYRILKQGYHPMLYSEGIENCKDNFLWFQDNFIKYDIPYPNLYLLEVRNKEWTIEQSRQLGEFIEFLVEWLQDKAGSDEGLIDAIFKDRAFNILSSVLLTNGRGMSCSVQATQVVRLGDLSIYPCHRTMYPSFKLAQMKVVDSKITGIESVNYPLYLATKFADLRNFPYCVACDIKEFCVGGCYGAQYETTGDLFTPIPTVCIMEHAKTMSVLRTLKYKTNIWERVKRSIGERKNSAIITLEKRDWL